jgi:uncharacterized metal-binding protein
MTIENPDADNTPIPTVQPKRIVIYACSGCSDAGELADRAARALSQKQLGEMGCLAGIGGRVKPLMAKAEKAEHILVIDGCPLNCARHTLALAGFKTVHHLQLHQLGLRKGTCSPTEARLALVVEAGAKMIGSIQESNTTSTVART